MNTKQIFGATILGTSAMTAFSYLVSAYKNKNFKEPELLGEVYQDLTQQNKEVSQLAGWGTHLGVGMTFTGMFAEIWEQTPLKPSIASGALLGAAAGVAGILGWMQLFQLEGESPTENKSEYYAQLMIAHIIFGMGAAAGYKLLDDKELSIKEWIENEAREIANNKKILHI